MSFDSCYYTLTDGSGNVTSYAYDDFGRVIKTTNALGNSAYTTYDNSGNVLTSTDYAGNLTTYAYDNFDRLTGKSNNDGTVNYTYTADGKIAALPTAQAQLCSHTALWTVLPMLIIRTEIMLHCLRQEKIPRKNR